MFLLSKNVLVVLFHDFIFISIKFTSSLKVFYRHKTVLLRMNEINRFLIEIALILNILHKTTKLVPIRVITPSQQTSKLVYRYELSTLLFY